MNPQQALERVTARSDAELLLSEALDLAAGLTPGGREHFWRIVRDECAKQLPPPASDARQPDPMSPAEVSRFARVTMPFGKHQGKAIDQVPLRYLDWLVGQPTDGFVAAVSRYLANETIRQQLILELEENP